MEKKNERIMISISLITFILLIFMSSCSKGVTPKDISENEVYPKGNISKAKIFDTYNNEKIVSLSRDDAEFIVQTLRGSKKELNKFGYESGLVQLNIIFSDSTIQLVRKDDETIYYVFHNNKIDGICYIIHSKDLSKLILKVSS